MDNKIDNNNWMQKPCVQFRNHTTNGDHAKHCVGLAAYDARIVIVVSRVQTAYPERYYGYHIIRHIPKYGFTIERTYFLKYETLRLIQGAIEALIRYDNKKEDNLCSGK